MEIKTLAEILNENADSLSKTSDSHKRNKLNKRQIRNTKGPRAKSKSARGLSVAQNSAQTTPNKTDTPNENNNNDNWRSNPSDYLSDPDQADAVDNLTGESYFNEDTPISSKRKKKKAFHPASSYYPKRVKTPPVKEVDPNSIKNLLAQVRAENYIASKNDALASTKDNQNNNVIYDDVNSELTSEIVNNSLISRSAPSTCIDNLPEALKSYLKTPEQRQAEKEDIKANSRLRWLAFYYLSRREHSAGELRQKLIDKEQDPTKIDELLKEFAEKGYQSDYRTALMLIREGIRKGRGRVRIKNDFYKRKVNMPVNIDELIDMAMEDNEAFIDVLSNNDLIDGVDWLRLAVEARVKKYGEAVPIEPKEKARQLRFLQYRGFKPDICFEAINYDLKTLDDRF